MSRYYSRLLSLEDLTLEVLAISNNSKNLGLGPSLKHSRAADVPLEAEIMEQMTNEWDRVIGKDLYLLLSLLFSQLFPICIAFQKYSSSLLAFKPAMSQEYPLSISRVYYNQNKC